MKAIHQKVDLDEGACIFGARILVKHDQALAEEVAGLLSGGQDPELIHRARVASRRLRATLPLFVDCMPPKKSKAWLKQIRGITKKLGEARDSDVQIEVLEEFISSLTDPKDAPGAERLLLRIRQQRGKLQEPVLDAMHRLDDSSILDEMQDFFESLASREDRVYLYTPTLYQHSFNAIQRRLDTFLGFEEVVSHPEAARELHEMRIAAKWLRYTLETFASLYSNELKDFINSVKETQNLLGDLHDCDVWLEYLPQFSLEEEQRTLDYTGSLESMQSLTPGLQNFKEDRQQKRDQSYLNFKANWQQWKDEGMWQALHQTIQAPFLRPEDIYPPLTTEPQQQDTNGH